MLIFSLQPMSLPCGHVFCKYCFAQWKKSCHQRPVDCPNCREKIGRVKVTPNVYLQNLIDSFIKDLGPDMIAAREKIVAERQSKHNQ